MSNDGAHLGVGAERALDTILGGKEQPAEKEKQTSEQVYARLKAATIADCNSYDGGATYCGKLVLDFYEAHPEALEWPAEQQYEVSDEPPADGKGFQMGEKWHVPIGPDLYESVKTHSTKEDYEKCFSELTGFMWGWAVNAARYALSQRPVPNPALVEIVV